MPLIRIQGPPQGHGGGGGGGALDEESARPGDVTSVCRREPCIYRHDQLPPAAITSQDKPTIIV